MPTAIEKIQAKAKALRKSYPNAKWTDLIKKASVDLKKIGAIGKVTTKKKATKKAATKKVKVLEVRKQYGTSKKSNDKRFQALPPGKRVSKNGRVYVERRANRTDKGVLLGIPKSTHKDTKSHNVNIRVVSGINANLKELTYYVHRLNELQMRLLGFQNDLKEGIKDKNTNYVKFVRDAIKLTKSQIANTKYHILLIKKSIK